VRGKSELYAVACFITRALLLGFATLLNFTLRIKLIYAQTVYSIS
jgi:hypothetical protein